MSDATDGLTLLRRAFDACDAAECDRLLAIDPALANRTAGDGLPFLLSAVHRESHGQTSGMSALFRRHGSVVDLFAASALGDSSAVQQLLESDASALEAQDAWEMRPLHWAAHCGHTELAAELLDRGADVNAPADSWTPLHLAVELGHRDTATLLIERGADLQARLDETHDRMTPIEMAMAWNLDEIAEHIRPHYS